MSKTTSACSNLACCHTWHIWLRADSHHCTSEKMMQWLQHTTTSCNNWWFSVIYLLLEFTMTNEEPLPKKVCVRFSLNISKDHVFWTFLYNGVQRLNKSCFVLFSFAFLAGSPQWIWYEDLDQRRAVYKVDSCSVVGDVGCWEDGCYLFELLKNTSLFSGGSSMKRMSRSWRQSTQSCVVST